MLKAEPDLCGRVEMFEDYEHFVEDENFFYESFPKEYWISLRRQGVVVVIGDATCVRILDRKTNKCPACGKSELGG